MKVAIYARVSSDEQAERNTVQNQLDYLRGRCLLDKIEIASEYVDDGVSGTVPLPQRRAGRRLLTDARKGEFEAVLVTKVDRLARSLRVLLDTHIALTAVGVAVKSATEPLDTGLPFGVFLFQLLGSMAELERNTILERTAIGRARIAKAGRWTGGRAPFGYAVVDGCLVEHPENAAIVRDIWSRVVNGATLQQEARERGWRASKLSRMLNSTVYLGELRLKSTVLSVPPLISPELWAKAHAVLKANLSRNVSKRRVNVLRGKLECASCGGTFVCGPSGARYAYYRCSSLVTKPNCGAVLLQAERIGEAAWRLCQEAIKQFPSAEDWRTILLDEQEPLPSGESLDAALAEVEAGIARLLVMVRQNTITLEEATGEIQAGKKEAARLQRQLSAIAHREESDRKWLALLEDEVRYLDVLKARMVDADPATRQDIISRLLTSATVKTHGLGRRKTGEVTFRWWYAVESVEVVTSRSSKRSS